MWKCKQQFNLRDPIQPETALEADLGHDQDLIEDLEESIHVDDHIVVHQDPIPVEVDHIVLIHIHQDLYQAEVYQRAQNLHIQGNLVFQEVVSVDLRVKVNK